MIDKAMFGLIPLSFAAAPDASAFADAVGAKPAVNDPGQASTAEFVYERAMYAKLMRELVPPRLTLDLGDQVATERAA